ncbi:MAG TPA: hypothetical protein VMV86_03850 [Methanosarcinales archaeon]|nr:hypothetical protein [Methanosarcinales archaeon]
MSIKKTTKQIVGASVGLGVGSTVLGAMGQGAIAGKTITPAANMMGAVVPAAYGMSIMDMASKYSKTRKPYRMKKGKLIGRGEW